MKKYVIFLVLFIAAFCVKAQPITPQVNENVELMSILSVWPVFRNITWIWRANI